jgi:hypothetical protein
VPGAWPESLGEELRSRRLLEPGASINKRKGLGIIVLQVSIAEPDGPIPICEALPEGKGTDSFIPTIIQKLEDPNYSASEVLHLISMELVHLCLEIGAHEKDAAANYILRAFRAQFKALRALADSIRRTEALRKKEDHLDFDGAKFLYVFGELLKCFDEAIQKTLGWNDRTTEQTAMRNFRDIVATRESEWRRAVARMS